MRSFLPVLALLTLLACSAKPEFTFEARPGATLESLQTIAFDPRKMAWVLEGQRPVRSEAMQRLVQEALEARGYRLVEPEAAEIWVDFVAMTPAKSDAPSGGGQEPGGGRGGRGPSGGGMGGGGGRGPGGAMGSGGGMGRGGGMGQGGEGAEASPGRSRHPMGFDPGGELTLRVQLLERASTQALWTGSVHLPAQKRGEQPDRRGSMREVVRRLLEPLPRSRATSAPEPRAR